ncbi:FAD:protein FMN transferase [Thermophagus sp. OGC60D27]|uniref:FAD:protein FMN transferase n=1 Tax=Thermophagus sp. OGC60D27 TaxID=3458415 RepID=UPI004037F3D0
MNTSLDIIFHGVDQECAELAATTIIREIKTLQELLDRHAPNAETFRINREAHQGMTSVNPLLAEYILRGCSYYRLTNGYFNIFGGTFYSSLKSNHPIAHSSFSSIGDPEELVEVNREDCRIRFLQRAVSLDFGGVGKGWALDLAAIILKEMEITNAFISFGGSSILTRGSHPHGTFWPFSLKASQRKDEVWKLNDDAVSVSSTRAGNQQQPHIWDNRKNEPVQEALLCCVQSPTAADAEVLSTALIVAPEEQHREITDHFKIKKYRVLKVTN